jgi:hypothetical protein
VSDRNRFGASARLAPEPTIAGGDKALLPLTPKEGRAVARKIVVQVSCDRCGGEVDSEKAVELSFGGVDYRTDLCAQHTAELTAALDPFLSVAERADTRRRSVSTTARATDGGPRRPTRRDPAQVGAIRTWARANGYEISDRGRIPREVEDAYNRRSN